MQTETLYKNLVPDAEINARKTNKLEGIDELAQQIKAKGLIEPLVVRAAGKGKFAIIDGDRRHAAIGKLIAAKEWPATKPVPITVREEDEASARETSLMANVGRLPMHAVDQYEAFAELERDERSPADIAATFGIPEKQVRQRLALGGLAAEIRAAWRDGRIDASVAQAFAVCPDKKLQAKLFKDLSKKGYLSDWEVRRALVNDRPKLDDPRVKFVSLERYRSAGGRVVEDLFGADGYLEDGALLKRLVTERLTERCAELVAEGWSFAVPAEEFPNHYSAQREYPKARYSKEQRARLKEIKAELDRLDKIEAAPEAPPLSEEDESLRQALYEEQDEIETAAQAAGFTKEQKAKTGCVLDVGNDEVTIVYGVYKKESRSPAHGAATPTLRARGPGGDDEPEESPGISGALMTTVTETLTLAAARAVAEAPDLAQRLAVAALTCHRDYPFQNAPVTLKAEGFRPAERVLEDEDDEQEGFKGALAELLNVPSAAVGKRLAACIAGALDLRQRHAGELSEDVVALIAALPGDEFTAAARELFMPDDYFDRAPARVAIAALIEIEGRNPCITKKKADIASLAASYARRTGWLPPELRHPEYRLLSADDKARKGKGRKAA